MRTIYMVTHKASSYNAERKVLRAYESEVDAKDTLRLMDGVASGTLEIMPIELAPASSKREIVFNLGTLGRLGPELPDDDDLEEAPQRPDPDFAEVGDMPDEPHTITPAEPGLP